MDNSASPHTQANTAVDPGWHLLPVPPDQYLLTAPVTAEPAGGQLQLAMAVGTVQGGTTGAPTVRFPLSYSGT